ncbi:12586_t:CDS:1, partial [Racocetra fulgida]
MEHWLRTFIDQKKSFLAGNKEDDTESNKFDDKENNLSITNPPVTKHKERSETK